MLSFFKDTGAYVPNGDFALNFVYIKPIQLIVQLATSMPCGIKIVEGFTRTQTGPADTCKLFCTPQLYVLSQMFGTEQMESLAMLHGCVAMYKTSMLQLVRDMSP